MPKTLASVSRRRRGHLRLVRSATVEVRAVGKSRVGLAFQSATSYVLLTSEQAADLAVRILHAVRPETLAPPTTHSPGRKGAEDA